MKLSLKITSLTIGALLTLPNTHDVHAQGAVSFPGYTKLVNVAGLIAPTDTHSFVFSYWYNTTVPDTMVIADSTTETSSVALMVTHIKEMSTDTIRLSTYIGDDLGNTISYIGIDPLPVDGGWHHIALAADLAQGKITYSYDGYQGTWDALFSFISGQLPFTLPVSGNTWTIGSAGGHRPILPWFFFNGIYMGTSQGLYNGYMAEVFARFKDGTYDDITNPNRPITRGHFARIWPNAQTRMIFGPQILGPGCRAVFFELPTICMRGDRNNFPRNLANEQGIGTIFTNIGPASLDTAPSDPFSTWGGLNEP